MNESPPLPADEYGYEECAPSPRRESPPLIYAMEMKPSLDVLVKGDHVPLPADRLARKQRIVGRRGGVGHMQLLQHAAMAAIEAMESDDDTGDGLQRQQMSLSAFYPPQPMSRERTSPRKRARRLSTHTPEQPDPSVAATGKLLRVSTLDDKDEDDPVRGLVRRTSRRTSYDSKITDTNNDFLQLSAHATGKAYSR